MILEIADFSIHPHHNEAFEEAIQRGLATVIAHAKGFEGFKVNRCIENPNRYVLAHVTSTMGVQQAGSPYALTYTGARGIYTGVGPSMGNNILVVDYETYMDSLHTTLDNSFLPSADWIEPDVSSGTTQVLFLTAPMIGKVVPTLIRGEVLAPLDAYAHINRDKLNGSVTAPRLFGRVSTPEVGA